MVKFMVLFRQPEDVAAFENAYNDFLALVERMPDVKRRQVTHTLGSPQGAPQYYRILEIYYDSQERMRQSLVTPTGQEAGRELARFRGGYDLLVAEVYEEEGGQTANNADA